MITPPYCLVSLSATLELINANPLLWVTNMYIWDLNTPSPQISCSWCFSPKSCGSHIKLRSLEPSNPTGDRNAPPIIRPSDEVLFLTRVLKWNKSAIRKRALAIETLLMQQAEKSRPGVMRQWSATVPPFNCILVCFSFQRAGEEDRCVVETSAYEHLLALNCTSRHTNSKSTHYVTEFVLKFQKCMVANVIKTCIEMVTPPPSQPGPINVALVPFSLPSLLDQTPGDGSWPRLDLIWVMYR